MYCFIISSFFSENSILFFFYINLPLYFISHDVTSLFLDIVLSLSVSLSLLFVFCIPFFFLPSLSLSLSLSSLPLPCEVDWWEPQETSAVLWKIDCTSASDEWSPVAIRESHVRESLCLESLKESPCQG